MDIKLFKEYLELRGMSFNQLAKALGIKTSYIYARLKHPERLSNEDIMKIANLLKLRPYEITNVFFPDEAIFSLSDFFR